MKDSKEVLEAILDCGIAAVVRAESAELALKAAEAVRQGGVNAIEVTFTVPGVLDIIRELAAKVGDEIVLGAGTVLTPEDASNAIEAGARFIVSPSTSVETIRTAKARGAAVFPGALTPTEVITAWQAGADVIKLFPANAVGPSYIKDLHGPFPKIPFMPTGGISMDNASDWLAAGAVALGVGGTLVDKKLMASGEFGEITERARKFRKIVQEFRAR